MSMSLVSIIIPSYNHEQYIKQAVESVISQSYENIELIVIDDGSKDYSLEYLRNVSDLRFTLIEQENAGAHSAINKGLSLAKGDYLTILNSDDIFHVDRLQECVPCLKVGVDLVATWIELINHKGKSLGVKKGWQNMLPWPINPPRHNFPKMDDFTLNLLMSNFVSTTSNIILTRRLYEKTGGMKNLRFVHDWDYLLRAARNFQCVLIDKPLMKYRTHQSNTISSNRSWMLFEICWIYAVHLKSFVKKLTPQSGVTNGISDEIDFLAQSINLQGNDKVMWMLQEFFYGHAKNGEVDPSEILLNNEQLRMSFIRHVKNG